jgi:hypothetical protein
VKPIRQRQATPIIVSGMIFLVVTLFFSVQVFRALLPFYSWNPFVNKITIGQDVIGKWQYGGVDDQGRMQFYNGFQTVKIPGTSPTFDAEGSYVVIKDHTPNTLTIQYPKAVILQWVIIFIAITVCLLGTIKLFFLAKWPSGKAGISKRRWKRRMRIPMKVRRVFWRR